MKSPQELLFARQINSIVPGGYDSLENIDSLKQNSAIQIVSLILQFCCTAQHIGSISAGRTAFNKLPRAWVIDNFRSIVEESVNLDDPWEYRRLLELLQHTYEDLFQAYVAIGLRSQSSEIRETASDFSKQ
jgi:hypothetical protein